MTEPARQFAYVAMNAEGRRISGRLAAADERTAFERLRRDGLTPVRIAVTGDNVATPRPGGVRLADGELAELLFELSALIAAGADVNTALALTARRSGRGRGTEVVRRIAKRVSGGERLSAAFAAALGAHGTMIGALVAAGETQGDLGGALAQAYAVLTGRLEMRRRIVDAAAYPAFILVGAVLALLVILLFVVPTLEPLVAGPGGEAGLSMRILLALSGALRDGGGALLGGLAGLLLAGLLARRYGLLTRWWDRVVLDGPARRTVSALVYGQFAQVMGQLLAAGVGVSEAMQVSAAAVASPLARARIEAAGGQVRNGAALSQALGALPRFPDAIVRMAMIGEQTGGLGDLLARAGGLEVETSARRIDRFAKAAGPALIILLGGVVGLLMGGLLGGLAGMGGALV